MADIAKLVYEVDSRQVQKAEKDLNRFSSTNQQAQQAMYGASSASQAASGSYKSAGSAARSAGSAIQGTAAASGGAITSLRTLASTVRGLAAAYGLMKGATAVMDSLHDQAELGDLANQLGTTTEYLSEMGYAAEQTGASADTFSDGLEKMTRRLGQVAQDGGGPAAKALQRMGLSIEDLQQMNPQQQFEAIAEGIRGIGSQSEQTAAAQQLFGRQNVDLVNTINEGSDALAGFQQEAQDVGASVSGDMAAGADDAVTAINSLQATTSGIINQIAQAFAPAIQGVANTLRGEFLDSVNSTGISMERWQDIISKVMGVVVNRVLSGVNVMTSAINGVTSAIKTAYNATSNVLSGNLSDAWNDVKSGFSDQVENMKQLGEEQYKRMGWSFGEAENEGIAEAREKQPEVKAQIGGGNNMPQAASAPTTTPANTGGGRQASTGKSEEQRQKERQEREAQQEREQRNREIEQSLNSLRSTQEQATDERMEQLQNIKDAQNQGMISEKRAAELTTRVWDQWGDQVEEATEGASTFATRAAENIQDQLGDTLEQTLQGNFDGILSSWANMLQKMIAEAASQKLGEALFGGFGSNSGDIGGIVGSLGGLFGGGGSRSSSGLATDLITGALPGFASGGYTGRGRKNDIAGLVHGNETVMNSNATKKYAPELNAMNDGKFGGEQVKKPSGGNFSPSINVNYNESDGGGSNDKQGDRDKFLDQMEGRLRQMWKKWNREDLDQGGPVSKSYRSQFGLRNNNRVA